MPKMREEVKQVVKPKGGNGMREILFRGKRIGNSEWVYGYYVPVCFGRFPCKPAIVPESDGTWEPIEVKKETVGQYTGLTDKNGKKVFEGDIVRYNDTIHKVIFCTINGSAFFGITMPDRGEIWNFDGITCANKMEVIGNIHDTPELLEGKS